MPAVSQAQREFLNARFGHAWVKKHHFDNPGKLPAHVGKKRRRKRRQAVLNQLSQGFGGKKAAPFKSGGGRSTASPRTAKGVPRKKS